MKPYWNLYISLSMVLLFSGCNPATDAPDEPDRPVSDTLLNALTTSDWDWLFPFRFGHPNSQGSTYNRGKKACEALDKTGSVESNPSCDIYSLEHFKDAVHAYNDYAIAREKPAFLHDGNLSQQAEELAAFLSNISRETSGSWSGASVQEGGWIEDDPQIGMRVWKGGLYWIEEIGHTTNPDGSVRTGGVLYADTHSPYSPVSNRSYHGRGPIQLSWNYNYGAYSAWLYRNSLFEAVIQTDTTLLHNPGLVSKDAHIAFLSAIWFWMTPQGIKPSAHDVMLGYTSHVSSSHHDPGLPRVNHTASSVPTRETTNDLRAIIAYRLGTTINIINGGNECNTAAKTHPGPPQRVSYYEAYVTYLNRQFNAQATTLGIGYLADRHVYDSSSAVIRYATCYSQQSYGQW